VKHQPPSPDSFLPLSPPVFHILLALGDGEKHGYAIMQDIPARTDGAIRLLAGTLYSTIKRMLASDLIEECDAPSGEPSEDERRRYYRLTPLGRKVASAEAARMATLVRIAQRKNLAPARASGGKGE
jgi:DNA-binding PadR family transcriptional regulator